MIANNRSGADIPFSHLRYILLYSPNGPCSCSVFPPAHYVSNYLFGFTPKLPVQLSFFFFYSYLPDCLWVTDHFPFAFRSSS